MSLTGLQARSTDQNQGEASTIGKEASDRPPVADPFANNLVLGSAVLSTVIVVAGFAWFHLPNMNNGLQTDELLSAWVTSDGLGDVVTRAQNYQGQSPLYWIFLWFWRNIVGSSSAMLRLPSLLGVIAACGLALRFGKELGSRLIGLSASLFIIGGSSLAFAATTARPYGFLPLCALLSTRGLWHWMRSGKTTYALQWSLGLVLSFGLTPFAATLAPVHLFALWDYRREHSTLPRGFFRYTTLAGLLSLPMLPQVLSFARRRDTFVLTAAPTPMDVLQVLMMSLILGIIGALLCADRGKDLRVRLFLVWAVLPVVLLYLAGVLGDSPVFLGRYRSVALFGAALLLGVVVHLLKPTAQAIAMIVVALMTVTSLAATHSKHLHGWENVTEWLNENSSPDEDRILAFNTGLVEAYQVEYLTDPYWTDYLTAAIDHYPIDAPHIIISMQHPDPELIDSWLSELMEHDTILVMDQVIPLHWIPLIREAVTAQGYVEFEGPQVGGGAATIFRRN